MPASAEPELMLVRNYWETLKRAANDMPFWDDFKPTALPESAATIMLIEVFYKPVRLRFGSIVGAEIEKHYGKQVGGMFSDEIEARSPFEFLNSQASAAIEGHQPTYYQHAGKQSQRGQPSSAYSRLLLPMWGEGQVGMLLGAFVWR
jgi:hypothetical protein